MWKNYICSSGNSIGKTLLVWKKKISSYTYKHKNKTKLGNNNVLSSGRVGSRQTWNWRAAFSRTSYRRSLKKLSEYYRSQFSCIFSGRILRNNVECRKKECKSFKFLVSILLSDLLKTSNFFHIIKFNFYVTFFRSLRCSWN